MLDWVPAAGAATPPVDGHGTETARLASPSAINTNVLRAVSCVSEQFCVAVGYTFVGQNDYPLAEFWNGSSWRIDSPPHPASGPGGSSQAALNGLSCTATTACVAVGFGSVGTGVYGLIEAWNGTAWGVEPAAQLGESTGDLAAVSCVAANDCNAVGWTESANSIDRTLAERWNGRTWAVKATGNAEGSGQLYGVSCSKPKACVAVGYGLPHSALTELWNGTSWRVQGGPTVATKYLTLTAVSCTSPDSCDAVGYQAIDGTASGLAESWNGKYWRIRPTPTPSHSGLTGQLSGISCIPATGDCEAGGQRSTSSQKLSLAEGWNGSYWKIQATPDPPGNSSLQGVSCSGPGSCVAVGATLSEVWNGTTWTMHSTPKG